MAAARSRCVSGRGWVLKREERGETAAVGAAATAAAPAGSEMNGRVGWGVDTVGAALLAAAGVLPAVLNALLLLLLWRWRLLLLAALGRLLPEEQRAARELPVGSRWVKGRWPWVTTQEG